MKVRMYDTQVLRGQRWLSTALLLYTAAITLHVPQPKFPLSGSLKSHRLFVLVHTTRTLVMFFLILFFIFVIFALFLFLHGHFHSPLSSVGFGICPMYTLQACCHHKNKRKSSLIIGSMYYAVENEM